MKIKTVEGPIITGKSSQYPKASQPEFMFAGRSNVGKSSLINSLLHRRNIAYTSGKPGKTQTINFYWINESFYLVDVPGYGYAKISKAKREAFGEMIEHYMHERKTLRHVFLLVDLRHTPTEDDALMVDYLEHLNRPYTILATKADKISKNKRIKHIKHIRETLDLPEDVFVYPYSSQTHESRDEVLAFMESFIK